MMNGNLQVGTAVVLIQRLPHTTAGTSRRFGTIVEVNKLQGRARIKWERIEYRPDDGRAMWTDTDTKRTWIKLDRLAVVPTVLPAADMGPEMFIPEIVG